MSNVKEVYYNDTIQLDEFILDFYELMSAEDGDLCYMKTPGSFYAPIGVQLPIYGIERTYLGLAIIENLTMHFNFTEISFRLYDIQTLSEEVYEKMQKICYENGEQLGIQK